MKLISVVIPAYNEGSNVRVMYQNVKAIFSNIPYRLQILFVDDGSVDDTIEHLRELSSESDGVVDYVQFSRNFGHQAAVTAGYAYAKGDAVISMDCDMQHPPELIVEMLAKWEQGYEVVYTRREEDKRQGLFKRKTSNMFYLSLGYLSDIKLEKGVADFRLLDRKVADVVNALSEDDPFLRGIVKWVGFKQYAIDYRPNERCAGETKYTIRKMCKLAMQGVTSFSVRPLHLAIWIGAIMSLLSILYLPYVIYSFYIGHAMAGWSSVIMTIVMLGGLQLMIIGIVGLYIGKIFIQSKSRPRYIVTETTLK